MNYQTAAASAAPAASPWPHLGPPVAYNALKQQQAAFENYRRQLSRQNSWLAIPALAPVATVIGLEAGGAALGRGAVATAERIPAEFWDAPVANAQPAPAWQNQTPAQLRAIGRKVFERVNGVRARDMLAEVHHIHPLEYNDMLPNADPNRPENLRGLREPAHDIATGEWAKFRRSLAGQRPTWPEFRSIYNRINKMTEPYEIRPGVPRSNQDPEDGGLY